MEGDRREDDIPREDRRERREREPEKDSAREDRRGSSRRESRDRDRDRDRSSRRRHRSRSRSRKRSRRRHSESRSPSRSRERRKKKKASNFSNAPPEGVDPAELAKLTAGAGDSSLQIAQMQALVAAQGSGGLPPGIPGMIPNMGLGMAASAMGMIDSSTKVSRELFVGNTTPNTQEMVLMEFLNAAMHQVNLNTAPGNPIIQCRVSNNFAFIELRSVEETNNCLSLNGIPFMGNILKLGRPTKYQGPQVPVSSWQQLTGQSTATPMVDPSTKVYRELFIGNTSPEMNEVDLQEFLGAAMQQVGITTQPGNPLMTTRFSGGKQFAFVELRSIEETNNALNLNGIPYMGMNLRVGRPSKYNGPPVPHLDWNDLLVKYMSGELKPQAAIKPPSKVVCLINMVTSDMLTDDADYNEILEDTREECNSFGEVTSITIPRNGQPGTGKVFVEYSNTEAATKASEALTGRTFDGRRVEVEYYDEEKYKAQDLTQENGGGNPGQ